MTTDFFADFKKLKPTSLDEVKAALASKRSHAGGVHAYPADVLLPEQKPKRSRGKVPKVESR